VGTQRLVVFDRAKGWGRMLTRRRAPESRRLRPDLPAAIMRMCEQALQALSSRYRDRVIANQSAGAPIFMSGLIQ
jgi:hypothetical protein